MNQTPPATRPVRRQYEDFMHHVLTHGVAKSDRTGTGTLSRVRPPDALRPVADGFPLVTTKKLHVKSIDRLRAAVVPEVATATSAGCRQNAAVTIWDEWADAKTASWVRSTASSGADWTTARRRPRRPDLRTAAADQDQPRHSRRIIVSAWNVADLPKMKLGTLPLRSSRPPWRRAPRRDSRAGCTCQLYQRSVRRLSWRAVQHRQLCAAHCTMLAQQCGLRARRVHLDGRRLSTSTATTWSRHARQLEREPHPYPVLKIARRPESLFEYVYEDFEVLEYQHHPAIKAPVAV
jgi:thymidylate synthase